VSRPGPRRSPAQRGLAGAVLATAAAVVLAVRGHVVTAALLAGIAGLLVTTAFVWLLRREDHR
jgi:hypothetical protein